MEALKNSIELNSEDTFRSIFDAVRENAGFVGNQASFRASDRAFTVYLRGEVSKDPGGLGQSMMNVVGNVFVDPKYDGNLIIRAEQIDAVTEDFDGEGTSPYEYTMEDLGALLGAIGALERRDLSAA